MSVQTVARSTVGAAGFSFETKTLPPLQNKYANSLQRSTAAEVFPFDIGSLNIHRTNPKRKQRATVATGFFNELDLDKIEACPKTRSLCPFLDTLTFPHPKGLAVDSEHNSSDVIPSEAEESLYCLYRNKNRHRAYQPIKGCRASFSQNDTNKRGCTLPISFCRPLILVEEAEKKSAWSHPGAFFYNEFIFKTLNLKPFVWNTFAKMKPHNSNKINTLIKLDGGTSAHFLALKPVSSKQLLQAKLSLRSRHPSPLKSCQLAVQDFNAISGTDTVLNALHIGDRKSGDRVALELRTGKRCSSLPSPA